MKKTTSSTKTKSKAKKTVATPQVAAFQTGADLRTALLIVSIIGNLFVLSLWVVLKVTTAYDAVLSQVFLGR